MPALLLRCAEFNPATDRHVACNQTFPYTIYSMFLVRPKEEALCLAGYDEIEE